MQLKTLRMFDAVCTTGSFGAAAQQLCTVQSNVTAHIKKLEDELGVQLLERCAPVRATSAGLALQPYARRMLQLHDEASALFAGSSAPAGSLRIGSMQTTAALRLPPVLARLHQRHPLIDLQLRTGSTAELLEALAAGALDCVLVSGRPPQPRWQAHEVFVEELVLVAGHPMQDLPAADQLLRTPFLAFPQGCSYRQRVELLLASQGVMAARIMEMGTLDAILGCVAAGMGHALLPRAVVEAQRHRFGVHCLSLPGTLRDEIARVGTYFVTGAPASWSPALRACAELLRVPATSATAD